MPQSNDMTHDLSSHVTIFSARSVSQARAWRMVAQFRLLAKTVIRSYSDRSVKCGGLVRRTRVVRWPRLRPLDDVGGVSAQFGTYQSHRDYAFGSQTKAISTVRRDTRFHLGYNCEVPADGAKSKTRHEAPGAAGRKWAATVLSSGEGWGTGGPSRQRSGGRR